ncbi:hypothetical protein BpHYR1_007231 [Brachionus plicatilis]|uniref:Uncharacterized protein n=1 Tax=Brachionus plicatilis TaxID=10195 RepID=A0A3M7Q444_BRAPC|nr:hypothetical protein BpHYR1_007231 [Brachionus plicatilis]
MNLISQFNIEKGKAYMSYCLELIHYLMIESKCFRCYAHLIGLNYCFYSWCFEYQYLKILGCLDYSKLYEAMTAVVLEDHGDVLNNKVKRQAVEILKKQKENLEQIFTSAVQNRDIVMDKAKIRHDRLIR